MEKIMQPIITGQNIEITPSIRDLTEKKIKKIFTHIDNITHVHVTYEVAKAEQKAHAQILIPGHQFNATASSTDIYKSIDLMINKLQRQIDDYKNRKDGHR